jgi:hypothetical protein
MQSAGLVLVHAHSRFVADAPGHGVGEGVPHGLLTHDQMADQYMKPSIPLWRFYLER